jgi:serine/threonine protein kinase
VADRYRLVTQIGVGAMGAVWLATDQRLHRQVALKQVVLEPGLDLRQASEARQRILREGRIAARLHHPHAVAVYDVTMQDGEPWLVMEYVRARTLAALLAEEGLVGDVGAARIGAQLADALDAAHRVGIAHRDVKPGNVLICADGSVKLADFGIARAAGDITVTQTGVLTGTPDYFAPEVARGAPPTSEADVFSLGATLYISVEGQPPFGVSDNALNHLHVVAAGQIRPPTRAGRLTEALYRLMDADPARRPTAAQARQLLREAVEAPDGTWSSAPAQGGRGRVPTPRSSDRGTAAAHRASGLEGLGLAGDSSGTGGRQPAPVVPAQTNRHDVDTRPPAGPLGRLSGASAVLPPPPGPHRRSRPSRWAGRRPVPASWSHRSRTLLIGGLAVAALLIALLSATIALGDHSSSFGADGISTSAPAAEGELTEATRAYYALLPANPRAAWERLTEHAHGQLGGQLAFVSFWKQVDDLTLVDAAASAPDQAVRSSLRLRTSDGRTRTVSQRLVLVPGPDGGWLIDNFGN